MSLYTRARKHIDINRVKELREDKIRREKIAEILKQQEIICAELAEIEAEESKYINWRRELKEGMNTGSIGLIHLPGDPDTIQTSLPSATLSSADNTAPPNEDGVTVRTQGFKISDSSKTDTITITISGSFGSKQIGGHTLNDKVSIGVLVNGTYGGNYLAQELGNGTHTISIPKRFQKANVRFDAIQVTAFEGGDGHQSGTVNITGIGLKRVNPMNVFIGLEDPDASAFLRDGQVDNLSPGEKKKKLEEQLASSKEYLNKMFGEGMPEGATEIADYELQQSFADIKVSLSPEDLKAISDREGGSYSGDQEIDDIASDARNPMGTGDQAAAAAALLASPMVQAAAAQGIAALAAFVGSIGLAKQIMKSINSGGTDYDAAPGRETTSPLPGRGGTAGGRSLTPQQQAEVEAAGNELRDARRALNDLPADATDAQKDMAQERLDRATKNRQRVRNKHKQENQQRPRTESYKPNSLYISEKKRLKSPKDLADKIPGYYDGKPAPLGFPIVEPPKMKDGMHPDLVDGKKTAKRFNRLDPISAKAMPPTGNPLIDKKVKAAAKKPK